MGGGTTTLGDFVWVPKPKTDLREFREAVKLALEIEERDGFFNDDSLAKEQVKRGAIFDGRLSPDDYVEKYKGESVANQSYVSNARMTMRLLRWFGWVTRTAKPGQFRVTPRGMEYAQFEGQWPDAFLGSAERMMMLEDILGFKYHCGNDVERYQAPGVEKRPMMAILAALKELGPLHNHEIAICSLTGVSEFDRSGIVAPVIRMRDGISTIQDEYRALGWDPEKKSYVTGVYDGPKVLCSILRQLGVVKQVEPDEAHQKYYERIYAGREIGSPPRNLFEITSLGQVELSQKMKRVPIWWNDLVKLTVAQERLDGD